MEKSLLQKNFFIYYKKEILEEKVLETTFPFFGTLAFYRQYREI